MPFDLYTQNKRTEKLKLRKLFEFEKFTISWNREKFMAVYYIANLNRLDYQNTMSKNLDLFDSLL